MLTYDQTISLWAIGRAHHIIAGRPEPCSKLRARLSPPVLDYMARRRIYGLGAQCLPYTDPLYRIHEIVWQAQRAALGVVIRAFGTAGIDILVFKGAEVNERHAESRVYTVRGDVDAIIRPHDVPKAKKILAELGFLQANYDTNVGSLVPIPPERLEPFEAGGYALASHGRIIEIPVSELPPLHQVSSCNPFYVYEDRLVIITTVDLSIGLDQKFKADSLFDSSISSAHGAGARALPVEDHLWYLSTMFYAHTLQYKHNHRLSQLADMVLLLANSPQLDWDHIVRTAEMYELLPSLYYPLAYLNAISSSELAPAGALARLLPSNGARARDYGWQLHKLLGLVEPLPLELVPSDSFDLPAANARSEAKEAGTSR